MELFHHLVVVIPGSGLGQLDGLNAFLGVVVEIHVRTPFTRRFLALSPCEC
jgi:hypothetical protein